MDKNQSSSLMFSSKAKSFGSNARTEPTTVADTNVPSNDLEEYQKILTIHVTDNYLSVQLKTAFSCILKYGLNNSINKFEHGEANNTMPQNAYKLIQGIIHDLDANIDIYNRVYAVQIIFVLEKLLNHTQKMIDKESIVFEAHLTEEEPCEYAAFDPIDESDNTIVDLSTFRLSQEPPNSGIKETVMDFKPIIDRLILKETKLVREVTNNLLTHATLHPRSKLL